MRTARLKVSKTMTSLVWGEGSRFYDELEFELKFPKGEAVT